MTENQIKEALSRHYFEALASRGGYSCTRPALDSGTDLYVSRQRPFQRNGETRYLETGEQIHVQLKATCEHQVIRTETTVKYDVEAKTYNDIVERQNQPIPLFLVVLVLPDSPDDWIAVGCEQLELRRNALWWFPLNGEQPTQNTSTIRIEIPVTNQVNLDFVPWCFQKVYE